MEVFSMRKALNFRTDQKLVEIDNKQKRGNLITQKDLGDLLGVSQSTISIHEKETKYENQHNKDKAEIARLSEENAILKQPMNQDRFA
jgi:DNA-binding XRE family transcriptional regulator